MANRQLETVGSLIKMDDVTTIQHNIIPNTLVFETIEPYPDYNGGEPHSFKPNLIFLITEGECSLERSIRTSSRIQKNFSVNIDACLANLKIYCDSYCGIRIRGLWSFEQIKQLQEFYISEGVKFLKYKSIKAPALIHLKKLFILEEIEEGIYKDLEEPMMWYFSVPEKLEWDMLKIITKNIKNNIENSNFDSAFGWIFINKITDIIRIYSDNLNLNIIKDFQVRYQNEIRKYLKQ